MKIGVFDSGIGGLSVLRRAMRKLPSCDFIYYADSDNVPYGERSEAEIIGYVDRAVDFMLERGAEAVVLACNTATSVAAAHLREQRSIPIVGMEPAVKKALDDFPGGRVLVVATPITVSGSKLKYLIGRVDKDHLVDTLPLPYLVRCAEEGNFDSAAVEDYLKCELSGFDLPAYSALVLGCTHFSYFRDSFGKILPSSVHLVDGSEGTVNQLARVIGMQDDAPQTESASVEYFESGRPASFERAARFNELIKRLDGLES